MPKGIQTGSYAAPQHATGATYAKVPSVNRGARGDMPTSAGGVPGKAGYRGPSDEPVFQNKSVGPISKLGVSHG